MKVERSAGRVRIRYLSTVDARAAAVRAGAVILFLVAIPAVLLWLDVPFPYPSPVPLVLILIGLVAVLGVEPHTVDASGAQGIAWHVPSMRGETTTPPPDEVHLTFDERGVDANDRPLVWWQVRASAAEGPAVAEKLDAELEMGEVAAELAIFYRVPCVRHLSDGRAVRIAPEDLGLPFLARVRKHPQLLGPLPPPSEAVDIRDEGSAVTWRWGAITAGTLVLLAVLWSLSYFYLMYRIPEPGSAEDVSVWERALRSRDMLQFAVTLGPTVLATLLAALFRASIRLEGDLLRVRTRLLVPLLSRAIPLAELAEIYADRGSLLLVASGRRIRLRFFDWATRRAARAVASDLRYRLASRG